MSEDLERFTRAEKEALLASLEKQIRNVAWRRIHKTKSKEFKRGADDLIASLTAEAWSRINSPDLEKNNSPEGYVMTAVRWKALDLAEEFTDKKHNERYLQRICSDVLDEEEEEHEEREVDWKDAPICDELRQLGDKEKGVIHCMGKGFRSPANIKTIFVRCELDAKGIDPIVAKHLGGRQSRKDGAHSVVKELVYEGITDIVEVRLELDRRGISYSPSRIVDYVRKFQKEKKCQE